MRLVRTEALPAPVMVAPPAAVRKSGFVRLHHPDDRGAVDRGGHRNSRYAECEHGREEHNAGRSSHDSTPNSFSRRA